MNDQGRPPDWQLPPGLSHGLWDYLHSSSIAHNYDASLAGTPLFHQDLAFAERWFARPGRLIDLGCGTGRLLIPFARKGFKVLGVDLSEAMLRVAGEKAAAAGALVDLLQANIVELSGLSAGAFDYAACLFSTLGMVTGEAPRRRVIENVQRLLRPGGRFVLHAHNRWFNFTDPAGRRWLVRNWLQALLGWEAAGDHVMPVHQGIVGLTLHLFTRGEVVRLLRGAGFRLLEICPVSLRPDGRVGLPAWLRAYGYLIAAERSTSV
jgi:SAM-dependent methyltransferase